VSVTTVRMAERLREAISETQIDQRLLAESAGVSRTELSDLLTGRMLNPTFDLVVRVARVLGESSDFLDDED
jgi:transcriptional regulator with XRE-family HTH domain